MCSCGTCSHLEHLLAARQTRKWREAAGLFRQALDVNPAYTNAAFSLLDVEAHMCDWDKPSLTVDEAMAMFKVWRGVPCVCAMRARARVCVCVCLCVCVCACVRASAAGSRRAKEARR